MIRNRNRIIVSVLIMLLVFSNVVSFAEQTESSSGYGRKTAEEKEIIELDFEVTDAVMDPDKPVLYATDKENMELISFNYETREKKVAKFVYDKDTVSVCVYGKDSTVGESVYMPRSMTFADGELYVSLVDANEDYNWSDEDRSGIIAILDSETLEERELLCVDVEPYQVKVDTDGYIYVIGRGRYDCIKSYDRSSLKEIDSDSINSIFYVSMDKYMNKIYTAYAAYSVDSGIFKEIRRQNDYDFSAESRISPDGKYLFNFNGDILNHSNNDYDDFLKIYDINHRFDDIAFDIKNNKFFTIFKHNKEKEIQVYDYENFGLIGTIESKFKIQKIFFENEKLLIISKDDENSYYIEVDDGDNMNLYNRTMINNQIAFTGLISDVIYDSNADRAYALNWTSKKLYIIDTVENEIEEEIKLEYRPSSLCFSQDKKGIYIANDDADYLVTEFDLEKREAKRHLKHKIREDYVTDSYLCKGYNKHVYINDDKLFIVLKDWSPDLLIFDKANFEQIEYGDMIDGVGDLGITRDGNEIFYSYQYGWHAGSAKSYISRYRIDGERLVFIEKTDLDYPEIQRNPVDSRIIMLEDKGLLISKDDVFDVNNIKNRIFQFDEPIYAVDSEHQIAIGTKSIYSLDSMKKIGLIKKENKNAENLFITKDGRLYNLSNYTERIYATKIPVIIGFDIQCVQVQIGSKHRSDVKVWDPKEINSDIIWTSSDEKVASVNKEGVVTGLGEGTTMIRATSEEDESYYAEYKIIVPKEIANIKLDKLNMEIKKGEQSKLSAKVDLENTTNDKLVWSTSDEKIASVSQDGTVTGVAGGTALIRATSQIDESYYAECVVNVTEEKSGGSSGGGSRGSGGGGGSSSSDDSATSRARIDIVKDEKGKTVKEIVLKDDEVIKAIDSKKESIVIEDDSSKVSDNAKVEISAKIMKKLNESEKTLEIKSGDVSFKIEPKSFETGKKEVKLNVSRLSSDKESENEEGLNMVSDSIFDFELEIGDKNYKDEFDKALTVTMPFDKKKASNNEKLGVYYFDEKENKWEYAGGKITGNGEITFKAQHFSKYAVMECDKTFNDIQNHWAKDSIEIMVSRQIVNGTSAQEFSPDKNITRAEFVALLSRALDMPEADGTKKFNDVEGKWYSDAVNSAYKAGIVNGMNGGMFAPDKSITREEMATMIVKAYSYAKDKNIEDMLSSKDSAFSDENECSAWAKQNIRLANEKGMMNGYSQDKTFRPKNNTTRAEAVVVLKNLLSKTDEL